MRLVKIAVASLDTTVGATRANVDGAIRLAAEQAAAGVTLGVFHEQLVGGYPSEDLVQWGAFVEAQRAGLARFAEKTARFGTVYVIGLTVAHQAHRYNAAAVVHRGAVVGVVPKEKLPTYNVFYEARTFSSGRPYLEGLLWGNVPFGDLLFQLDWGVLAVEVCEDIWSPDGPMRRRVYSGAEVIANVSESPYRLGVLATRREMLATRSADNQCVVAYANGVGAQDSLIFDGGGWIYQSGRLLLEAPRFVEGWAAHVVDLDRTTRLRAENTTWREDALSYLAAAQRVRTVVASGAGADRAGLAYPTPPRDPKTEFCEELLDALVLGVGDYFEKNRFKLIGLALSGGRDSLLALLIVHRYVARRHGPAKVPELLRTFYMPTRYSSSKT